MRTAVFPGSFDPFTLGHLDVLNSALKLFDKVIVAVGYNSGKKGFFLPQTRVEIIRQAIGENPRVEICSYTGLTVDLCKDKKADFIVRGLRTTTDFDLESVISQANRTMKPELLTVFIPAGHEYSFISSTVVRDLIVNGGDASGFLPKGVDISGFIEQSRRDK